MVSLIQQFEADFLWKVSLKILNSGIILKTFTHADMDDADKLHVHCAGGTLKNRSRSAIS